jgi:flagellar hook-length control protein FliK
MQSVLKLMPDPIPEVPRDGASQQDSALGGQGRGEFDSVYEQQLYQNNRPAQNQRPDQGGNDSQSVRQPLGSEVAHKAANESEQSHATQQQATKSADSEAGQKDGGEQAPKSFDQLLDVVDKAEKMLRQTNGVAVGEPHGDGEQLLRQNKLTAAIDHALVDQQGGKEQPSKEMIDKLANQGAGDEKAQGSKYIPQLTPPGELKSDGGKKLTLDDFQTPGINPKLQVEMDQQAGGKGEKFIDHPAHQSAGIKSAKDEAAGKDVKPGIQLPDGQSGKGKPTLDDIQTPGIAGVSEEAVAGKNGNKAGETPGINPKGELAADKGGIKSDKPTIALNEKSGGADITRPFDLADPKQDDVAIKGSGMNETPGIASPSEEELAQQGVKVTRPVELDPKLAKVLGQAGQTPPIQTNNEPVIAQAQAAQMQAKNTADKAESVLFSGMTADKKDNKNILGTETKSAAKGKASNKTDNATVTAETAKLNPEQQMSEKKLMESLMAQSKSEQQPQVVEDTLSRLMPKELSTGFLSKTASQFNPVNNPFAADHSMTSTSPLTAKGEAKMTAQMNEALNFTRPDFSNNMKERLTVMMNRGIQTADIRLDPAELGQMQVKMQVENDVTTVNFVVQNAQAKEMLEQAMPKLKEMLEEQGIEMGEGTVEQEDKSQRELGDGEHQGGGQMAAENPEAGEEIDPVAAQQVKIINGALGGIDFFA